MVESRNAGLNHLPSGFDFIHRPATRRRSYTIHRVCHLDNNLTFTNRDAVVAAMAEHRVPAIYGIAEMVRSGGLISYGQDLGAQWRMSAQYIDQIVRGAKSADLPVQYATRYALADNVQAAKTLGLVVPPDMLKRADEVIE